MILSMTGFGKSIAAIPNKKITVEIKSLNSKQLDITSRVPAAFREKELSFRVDRSGAYCVAQCPAYGLIQGSGGRDGSSAWYSLA